MLAQAGAGKALEIGVERRIHRVERGAVAVGGALKQGGDLRRFGFVGHSFERSARGSQRLPKAGRRVPCLTGLRRLGAAPILRRPRTRTPAMTRTPVADWQQLSALYELADTLDPDSLNEWLRQLAQQPHPLLPQLQQMLAARSQVRHNGFLGTLPRLSTTPEPRAIEWHAGSRIGPYKLLRKLGSGGMAEVWLAQRDDGAFQRQVAIKLLFRHAGSNGRDTFAQRFDRERDILASLNHPHIAGLHDAGVTPSGQPWLALEYVEGQTLTDWCDARYLGVEPRVRLFRQVLLAVQHAHANLVIHRDLKPGNILVTAQGEVRLLDFGIAKLMEPEGAASIETELTRMAGRPMTPQYAAPEQLLGQPLTTACDVYSLGVVLYELLCGERPYELKVESAAQLEDAILEMEPRAPSRRALSEPTAMARGTTSVMLRKLLGSDLDAIVLRALAKQPAQRYGSVEALGADLDRWLGGEPVEARAPSTVYRVGKFVRRHTLSVSLGVGAVVALVCVTAVALVMGLQAREDSARAVAARDFMLNIFQRANQEKSRGADITARDLLETGRKDVMTRLAGQPRLQAELLRGIAKIQVDMGEYASADSTYDELVRLLAALQEPGQEAWARADHAYNAFQMGNPMLAASLLQQAKDVRSRPVSDGELNARFSELSGWIAVKNGDATGARKGLLVARERATEALGANHLSTFRLGQALLRVEGQLRDFDAALALHGELRQVAPQVRGLDVDELARMDWEQVTLLQEAGQFARALTLVDTALPTCIASLGPDSQNCRMILILRGQILLRLGLVQRAQGDMPQLAVLADD
ncbi:MAG: serine/threonine protein kinase, partial [Rhizobiales bacterium]|nr:serine/threonine protein kinase [Rhizobacter sp.]